MPDAYLLLSYGGPDKPEDIIPFLRNATGGRGIPDERLEEVGEHYHLFGGKSPINELNQRLMENLKDELSRRGDNRPMELGNRNWHPYGTEAIQKLYEAGARNIRAITTAAYSSYSSCRQYREDIARWIGELGYEDLTIEKVGPYWNTPGFFEATRRAVKKALDEGCGCSRLVFVTHSIPTAMNEASGRALPLTYEEQHLDLASRLASDLGVKEWDLVYCSRSGAPHIPWLEPDVCDHLEDLAERGIRSVVLAPIGFISDHMEVLYDLDTEAKAKAEELKMGFVRAATIDDDPQFISQLADLLEDPGSTSYSADSCWAGHEPPTVPAVGED